MAPATLESPIPQDVPPAQQRALLLYGPGEIYKLDEAYQVPQKLHATEVLVKTATIGLNPIDWKAPFVPLKSRCHLKNMLILYVIVISILAYHRIRTYLGVSWLEK